MASQALYLKWRSQTFEEIIGQEHVTKTLRNALERDRIAHAYLFCGPRGTGKTSTARILAKAVNCVSDDETKPCNQCEICLAINAGTLLDLIEIDAASHTGVDNVRDIIDKVGFRPNQARYKVYVIDEVHMLSKHAFNALLKTLEEPPPHVIFVLATTEPEKIPITVISRCQRFDFRFVPTSEIAAHLRVMADSEEMKIDQEAINLIAAHAGGAVRDAVTLLDQLTAYSDDGITAEHVQQILGIGALDTLADLVDAVVDKQLGAGLEIIDQLIDQGMQLRQFNAELLEYLRGMLLVKAGGDSQLLHLSPDARRRLREQTKQVELNQLVRYARLFNGAAQGLRTSLQPQLPLELALIEAVSAVDRVEPSHSTTSATSPPAGRPKQAPRSQSAATDSRQPAAQTRQAARPAEGASAAGPDQAKHAAPSMPAGDISVSAISDRWEDILRAVRPVNKDAEAFLRAARPVALEGDTLIISFKHSFHKDKFEQLGCGEVVDGVISRMVERQMHIRCQLEGKPLPTAPQTNQSSGTKSAGGTPEAPPADAESAESMKGHDSKRESDAAAPVPDTVNSDPVVKAATEELGARVIKVMPSDGSLDEPPVPEEPPPLDSL